MSALITIGENVLMYYKCISPNFLLEKVVSATMASIAKKLDWDPVPKINKVKFLDF